MKRIVFLGFCTLLSMAAWGDILELTNQFGSVTVTNAGIDITRSELTGFALNWREAPPGHHLGSISFSTGALLKGTLFGGGVFSSNGSSFVATGLGKYGVPKGTIFSGSFEGPISWVLASHSGNNYLFALEGDIEGTLFNGRQISGTTVQTVYVNRDVWNYNERGTLHSGHTRIAPPLLAAPEPDTRLLSATGVAMIIAIAGVIRRRRIRA